MKNGLQFLACTSALAYAGTALGQVDNYDCVIQARQNIEIRSPVEATIESVRVKRGDWVSKGQILATLESGPERAAFALAQTRAQAVGEIKSAEVRVDITQKKLKRAEELVKQNFVSANARDEAEAEHKLATTELRRAHENQKIAFHEAKRSEEVLAMRTIRSPFSGVVVEVLLKPGESGAITVKLPILRLAEVDPLYVEVILPVSLYGRVKTGQHASVMPESPVGGRYDTVVKVVDQVVDAASGTFGVRLELPNRNRALPAGVRCKVEFR
jgi:RND family efflux transporter MFP subunit